MLSTQVLIRHLDVPGMATLYRDVARAVEPIPVDFFGGCSLSKGYVMAELIRRFHLTTSLDIGIYRGRSFFPQAISHRAFTGGVVYGVDPYSMGEAVENDCGDLKDKVLEFASRLDFDELYASVETRIRALGLDHNAVLLRKTSMQAVPELVARDVFFGLIHVDGNHDTTRVMEDLDAYVPRLRPGGFVVLDDISWDSVRPAYNRLSRAMTHVFERVDSRNDYAVFWAGGDRAAHVALRTLLAAIGRRWQLPRYRQ